MVVSLLGTDKTLNMHFPGAIGTTLHSSWLQWFVFPTEMKVGWKYCTVEGAFVEGRGLEIPCCYHLHDRERRRELSVHLLSNKSEIFEVSA